MPTKRDLGLLGTFLAVLGGLVLVIASLDALDYLVAVDASPTVLWLARVLLNPPVAVIVLLLGCVLAVRAWQMPGGGEHELKAEPEARGADDSEPNMVVFSLHVLPVDRSMQLSGPETGAKGCDHPIQKRRNSAAVAGHDGWYEGDDRRNAGGEPYTCNWPMDGREIALSGLLPR